LGSEISTFEVEDVSDDIRSSVSNGFSSSKVSIVVLDDIEITHRHVNMRAYAALSEFGWTRETKRLALGENRKTEETIITGRVATVIYIRSSQARFKAVSK
jgi:hypothetical protein